MPSELDVKSALTSTCGFVRTPQCCLMDESASMPSTRRRRAHPYNGLTSAMTYRRASVCIKPITPS